MTIELRSIAPSVAEILIRRPEARNALDFETQEKLAATIGKCIEDSGLMAVIITGEGTAFAAGGDLAELARFSAPEDGLRLSTLVGDALALLRMGRLNSVASVNGHARGGGAEIAISANYRIMAESADLAFVHSKLGLSPGWGGRARLVDLLGESMAEDLLNTARVVSSGEAKRIGLVHEVVSPESLRERSAEVAVEYSRTSPALRRFKQRDTAKSQRKQLLEERAEFLRRWKTDQRRELFTKFANG
ncbi:MAG: enoyl-CoA hydratase/isomerase family protein [Anaerolineae bacterium]|nr:MAG: enoyl-CoA hydratase/isomerase family protein [Anaerolineae bacterium]